MRQLCAYLPRVAAEIDGRRCGDDVVFDDIGTPLEYVISSDRGQQVSIFGTAPAQIGALVDLLVNQVCRVNLNCECPRGPDVFAFAGRKDCRNDSAEFNANAALTNRQRRPFAHFSEILAEGFSSLQEGRKVSLNVKQGPKGKQAADVQPM